MCSTLLRAPRTERLVLPPCCRISAVRVDSEGRDALSFSDAFWVIEKKGSPRLRLAVNTVLRCGFMDAASELECLCTGGRHRRLICWDPGASSPEFPEFILWSLCRA